MMLMKVAEDYGFRIKTFQHVLEGYKVADEIAKHGAGASTFADMWAYKMEAWDAIPHNAALMAQTGCERFHQFGQRRACAPALYRKRRWP